MIQRLAAFLITAVGTGPAFACPEPFEALLFHSCWGEARAEILLLPEDLPVPTPGGDGSRLVVTGAYTGRDSRSEGLPNPVGLFVDGGKVINHHLGRMDGVLLVDPASGVPALHHRRKVPLSGNVYDLSVLAQRQAFVGAAAAGGVSVLQSHLLIVDGAVDVRHDPDAPIFVRRLLFVDDDGFGIYQTRAARSLFDAATELDRVISPRMALNLDMGTYDYCLRAERGSEANCGSLHSDNTGKLSNLLVLTLL